MCGNLGALLLQCSKGRASELIQILVQMVEATSIRGAQGGGLSVCEWGLEALLNTNASDPAAAEFDLEMGIESGPKLVASSTQDLNPRMNRVKVVGLKRRNLALQLAKAVQGKIRFRDGPRMAATIIGHTRFATGSRNELNELHPHQWCAPRHENVWVYSSDKGLHSVNALVAINITHNGDFDALDAFNVTLTNSDLGVRLGQILREDCPLRGDSPKIAGFMDFTRVQGRLAAAARLAWVRMCDGLEKLRDIPEWGTWLAWESRVLAPAVERCISQGVVYDAQGPRYRVQGSAIRELIKAAMDILSTVQSDGESHVRQMADSWTTVQKRSFMHHAFRGFLRSDTYTAVTELLSRGHGSFGLQVHCTLEPGTVVLGCKRQPMSMAFNEQLELPIAFFGSETMALISAVNYFRKSTLAVDAKQNVNFGVFDLDVTGEIVRIGAASAYDDEGSYKDEEVKNDRLAINLANGLQIRVYNVERSCELSPADIRSRVCQVEAPADADVSPSPCKDRSKDSMCDDQVARDLLDTPRVVADIDRCWMSGEKEILWKRNRDAASSFAARLVGLMCDRRRHRTDSIDLLIGGCEISLWLAEQFAADMRDVFPNIEIVCVSANCLLGLYSDGRKKVVFPGKTQVRPENLGPNTAVLLLSQCGQTFPTLNFTNEFVKHRPQDLWVLVGEQNTKMEKSVRRGFVEAGLEYKEDRVIFNCAGHRPAEPSSVAVVATHHTLTHMLMRTTHLLHIYRDAAKTIIRKYRRHKRKRAHTWNPSGSRTSDAHPAAPVVNTGRLLPNQRSQTLCCLSRDCLEDLWSIISPCLVGNLEQICGAAKERAPDCNVHEELVSWGRYWGKHVTEPWRAMVIAGTYVVVTVAFGAPIVTTLLRLALRGYEEECSITFDVMHPSASPANRDFFGWFCAAIGFVARIADAVVYIFIAFIAARCLRLWDKRAIWARMGSRTVVIADSQMNHQLLDAFLSKLFSQAYSFMSVYVYSANLVDDFVHRYTHRVSRGVLLAVGRPDGRLSALSKTETAGLLAIKQARFIENFDYKGEGSGPEILSIGHNPYRDEVVEKGHIVLPSDTRRPFLDEYLYSALLRDADEFDIGNMKRALSSMSELVIKEREELLVQNSLMKYKSYAKYAPQGNSAIGSFLLPFGLHHFAAGKGKGDASKGCADIQEGASLRARSVTLAASIRMMRSLQTSMDLQLSAAGQTDVVGSSPAKSYMNNSPLKMYNLTPSSTPTKHYMATPEASPIKPLPATPEAEAIVVPIKPMASAASVLLTESITFSPGGSPTKKSKAPVTKEEWQTESRELRSTSVANKAPALKNKNARFEPARMLGFYSGLTSEWEDVQERQALVQRLCESRSAAIERYVAFCVVFHAMAKECHKPILRTPWPLARSQSNLRVATTAAPVSAVVGGEEELPVEIIEGFRKFSANMSGVIRNF